MSECAENELVYLQGKVVYDLGRRHLAGQLALQLFFINLISITLH